ncbi:MAG: Hsp20/alpha crystallin family protein [Bacteroidales bacterium]
MTLVKWYDRPQFNEWFDPFFVSERRHGKASCGCNPATNIYETPEAFVIEMAVPGMNKEDFSINFEKDLLTLSSEKENKTEDNYTYTRREFIPGAFKRSYIVPKSVDTENIAADYEHGILKVTLPKKEEAKVNISKQINVN